MGARRFLRVAAATVAVLAVLVAALTVSVDPYYVFGTPRVAGWNLRKPAASNRVVAAKAYQLERSAPRTLLLGNSRVEIGFDPDSPAWPPAMRPVFNASIPGYGPVISARLLEDALATPGLRHVLVGVDLLDFLRLPEPAFPPGPVDAGAEGARMRGGPDGAFDRYRWLARARDVLESTLTVDAVVDSVSTVLAQHRAVSTTMTPQGYNPIAEYHDFVAHHGFRELFDNKFEQYSSRFAKYPKVDFAEPYRNQSFAALRAIVTTAVAHDLDLVLVVYPYHAAVLDLLRRDGLWASGEAWRRALAVEVAKLDPAGRVRIVDFSGYNPHTTEAVPEPGDRATRLRWYWEPGHFQSALGDEMIARLYGGGGDPRFGRDLAPATVDAVNAALAAEAAGYPIDRRGAMTTPPAPPRR